MNLLEPRPVLDRLGVFALASLLPRALGVECLQWEHETLKEVVEARWGKFSLLTANKMEAARLLLTNSSPWEDWGALEKVGQCVSEQMPLFDVMQPLEAEDLAVLVDVMGRIATVEFSKDVQRYLAASLLHDGVWYFASPFKFLRDELDEYDAREGVKREHAQLHAVMSLGPFKDPGDDPIKVQCNRVHGYVDYLKQYRSLEEQQLKTVAKLIGKQA